MSELWDILSTMFLIVFTIVGIRLLDRYVFNKHRNRNRDKEQYMSELVRMTCGVFLVMFVISGLGGAIVSLLYTWVNCKYKEMRWK